MITTADFELDDTENCIDVAEVIATETGLWRYCDSVQQSSNGLVRVIFSSIGMSGISPEHGLKLEGTGISIVGVSVDGDEVTVTYSTDDTETSGDVIEVDEETYEQRISSLNDE